MSSQATLTVTSGPDQGKVFQLREELVHVGRAPQNQVALNDSQLSDLQASIVNRDGRYAIYAPFEKAVQVDGNSIPAQRWVWLPPRARIRIGETTAFEFEDVAQQASDPSASSVREAATTTRTKQAARSKRGGKRSEKGSRSVARFITDQPGDPLVKLGEDGQLPELALSEGPTRDQKEKADQQTNPLFVYGLVALSFCLSVGMLLIDLDPAGRRTAGRRRAQRNIVAFYGEEGRTLEPYQELLREAQLAHSRNDREAEQQSYRAVLVLLNSEDNSRFTGLTGSPEKDATLSELLGILLSE
jgi:hypothetical protein